MPKQSAGLLIYRVRNKISEVLLVHPGGPFFAKKDIDTWSIPKGEFEEPEDALTAAKRETAEETGVQIEGDFIPLQPVKLKSGKIVYAWAVAADPDLTAFKSNAFSMQWPPNSGKFQEFPEVDKAEWFTIEVAKEKINSTQAGFLEQLILLTK